MNTQKNTQKHRESIHITPMLLRSWGACWTDAQIAAYFAGRESLTPREIAEDLAHISHSDRMWVLTMALAHRDRASLVGVGKLRDLLARIEA